MSETTEAPTLDDRADLRADLEATLAGIDKAAPETEAAEETAEPSDGRARDAQGRFAPKEATEEATTTEAPTETKEEAPEPTTEAKPEPKSAEPPELWTAADKEMFRKQPPEAQAFLLRRMNEMVADYTHKTTEIAALRRDYAPVAQMLEPHRGVMRSKGFEPATLIKAWMNTEVQLNKPEIAAQVAANLIKGYNIDPAQVMQRLGWQPPPVQPQVPAEGQDGTQQPQQIQLPPEVVAQLNGVMSRVQSFEQHLQHQEAQKQIQQQQAHEAAAAQVMNAIQQFADEKDANGALLRPHFRDVEHDMAALADVARQKGGDIPPLAQLYETAVWANPITRGRIQADQTAALEAQRQAKEATRVSEARAKAAKAQRAGSPVVGAPGTGHAEARTGPLSLRDDLRSALEQHTG